MNRQLIRFALCVVVGAIAVGIGLYFGRFIAGAAAFPFASSRQAISFVTGIVWWAFIGVMLGLGLALTGATERRARLVLLTVLGFALGGALAAWLGSMGSADRNATLTTLSAPLGGVVAGLLMGWGARLGLRALAMAVVAGVAMLIARPHLEALIPPSDVLALLIPGVLIGAALAALAPRN